MKAIADLDLLGFLGYANGSKTMFPSMHSSVSLGDCLSLKPEQSHINNATQSILQATSCLAVLPQTGHPSSRDRLCCHHLLEAAAELS